MFSVFFWFLNLSKLKGGTIDLPLVSPFVCSFVTSFSRYPVIYNYAFLNLYFTIKKLLFFPEICLSKTTLWLLSCIWYVFLNWLIPSKYIPYKLILYDYLFQKRKIRVCHFVLEQIMYVLCCMVTIFFS